MRTMWTIGAVGFIILLGVVGYFLFAQRGTNINVPEGKTNEETQSLMPSLKHIDFSTLNSAFRFSGQIPSEFEVEYIFQLKALNVYDPRLPGENTRNKSQIYISKFEADRFLTLKTVEITQRDETPINEHDAILYAITKKANVPDFPGQPGWRNAKHKSLDIRFAKTNPSIFYPFAYNPVLSGSVFNAFIDSLVFHNDAASFKPPLGRLNEGTIKKPFGLKVSPQDSPIQPEFFTGYHTAIDYEILPGEENQNVPVVAFCGGELRIKKIANGYGGVAVQDCLIQDDIVTVVYGHLAFESIVRDIGSYFAPGSAIGNLASAGKEAGGERKHLHFGIHRGSQIDIRGYVDTQDELKSWMDPAFVFD